MAARKGRAPYPPHVRRSEVIQFRLTPREADALRQAARRDGQTVSDYLRDRIRQLALPFGPHGE